jgi:hypothetical protein
MELRADPEERQAQAQQASLLVEIKRLRLDLANAKAEAEIKKLKTAGEGDPTTYPWNFLTFYREAYRRASLTAGEFERQAQAQQLKREDAEAAAAS